MHNSVLDHLYAVVKWPQAHPQRNVMGDPVQVWCNNLLEHDTSSDFLPLEKIACSVDCYRLCEFKLESSDCDSSH